MKDVFDICVKELLIPFESYAKKLQNGNCVSYPDPASVLLSMSPEQRDELTPEEYEEAGAPWTIGYGSTFDEKGDKIKPGTIWTHERAVKVKTIALNKFYISLSILSPDILFEHPRRQAAVLSWIYNIGSKNYEKSTFRKRINEKNWLLAAEECKRWDKAKR